MKNIFLFLALAASLAAAPSTPLNNVVIQNAGTAITGVVQQNGATPAASAGLTSGRVPFATTGGLLTDDSAFTYNGSTDILTAAGFTSTVATGTAPLVVASTTLVSNLHAATADSATAVTNVGVTDDTTTNATMYPTWVTAATGNLPVKVSSTKLTFNPSTDTIGVADGFSILSAGSIDLTAGGSNENVTLTPSGTGATVLGGNVRVGSAAINSTAGKILTMLSGNTGNGYSEIEIYGFDNTKGGSIALGGGSILFASLASAADTSPGGQLLIRTANAAGTPTTALTINKSQQLAISDATDASSTTTGSLTSLGGASWAKAGFFGTNLAVGGTLDPIASGGRHMSVVASSGFSSFDIYGSGSTNGGQIDMGSGTIRFTQFVGSRDSSGNQGILTIRVNAGSAATSLSDALTIDHNLLTTVKGNLVVGASTSSILGAAGNMTITAGTGASRTMALQTTTSGSTATTALAISAAQNTTLTGDGGTGGVLVVTGNSTATAGSKMVSISQTNTATSGSTVGVSITPTYNQASGNAANTDLLVNRTQTLVGSGAQLLIDAQVSGTSEFAVVTHASNPQVNVGGTSMAKPAQLGFLNSNGSSLITLNSGGTQWTFNDNSAGRSMIFQHNGSATVTLDTSQNTTLAANLKVTKRWSPGVTSTATAAGTTTLTTTSTLVQIFTGSTTQNVTLPAANLDGAGFSTSFVIKNRSSGAVTINRAGSDTIDGATSYNLAAGTSITLYSDSVSDWTVN